MKRIVFLIVVFIYISINIYGSGSWNENLPVNICFGDDNIYKIEYCCSNLTNFKNATWVLKKYKNETWGNEKIIDGTILRDISPINNTLSNSIRLELKFDEYLSIGKYRIELTAYKGIANKPYTTHVEFNIYYADINCVIKTDLDSYNTNQQLIVCPGEDATYRFYIDEISNTDLKWTIEQEGAVIEDPDSNATEKNITFESTDANEYKIIVNEASGCWINKEITVKPIKEPEIVNIIEIESKTICKEGAKNILKITQQTWGKSYEWSIFSGGSYIDITGDENICYVDVKDRGNIGDEFKVKVLISDGCYTKPLISKPFIINDIFAKGNNYIN